MKKKFILIIIFIIVFILFLVKIVGSNKIDYKLKIKKDKFEISQVKEADNYYIEIKTKKNIFPIKLKGKYKKNKLVTDVYYYKDKEYECVIPLIKEEVKIDGMCYKGKSLYNISQIDNEKIKKFIDKSKKYSISDFTDNLSNGIKNTTITEYKSNKVSKSIAVSTYKGLYNDYEFVDLFIKDVYNNELSLFIDNYYVVADYNSNYTFNKFYLIDLSTNKKIELKTKYDISFDSYIQGVVDNIIYLYDIDNEVQYTVDVENKKVKLISDEDIKYYTNGKWETIPTKKANKKLYFDYTTLDDPYKKYDTLIKNDDNKIYYILEKDDKRYELYLSYYENIDLMKHITTTKTNDIKYKNDYIYYVDGDYLYYYSEGTGIRKLLKNTEFKFNDTIKYYVY